MNISNVRRSLTPNHKKYHKTIKNNIKPKKNKPKIKVYSKYLNSNAHLNDLIAKMRCYKDLLHKTSDLKSLFLVDAYGLKYSNELKKIINHVKKHIFPIPPHYNFSMNQKKKTQNIDNNNKNSVLLINKRKSTIKKEEQNGDNVFDLTGNIKTNREKSLNQEIFNRGKKIKKLLNLKRQIFFLDRDESLSNKKNKNLEFLRNKNVKKNIYDKIRSKYKRPKTAEFRFKNNFSKISNNLSSFNTPNFLSNNSNYQNKFFSDETNNKDENSKNYFNEISENINYYKNKMKSYKIKNILNWENINAFSENTNNITPNISIYRASQIKSSNIPIKQKFKQIIFSNQSQEATSIKSPNEKNQSQEINYSLSIKSQKKNFVDKLNKLENKSNIINQNFSDYADKSQEICSKFFNKLTPKKSKEDLNVKEINDHFNFSKGFETDLESLLKKNANKVKKIMDPKCGKILDEIVKEVCLEENKLNKNYFLYFKEEKPENKTQIMNKYNNMFQDESDYVLNMFKNKEDDFFNAIRNKKNYVNDIEQLYRKAKIIKKLGKRD